MKLKNAEVLDAATALQTLVKLSLPVRVSYKVAKLAIAVQAAQGPFTMAKQGILEKHGTPKEDEPGMFNLGQEGISAYNELLHIEAEVDAAPLTLDDLGDASVEAEVLVKLGPLLTEGG